MDECTDKLKTKKNSVQQMADHCDSSENNLSERPDISRRKFTRNVLVGSAVLLTLTNRSAWGLKVAPCISTNLLMSYRNGQISALTMEQQQEIDDFERYRDYIKPNTQPEDINGTTCYEATLPNDNSDNTGTTTEATLWFEPDVTNQ